MKILVTGGAGYIGSVLVPMLLKEGHKVTVLDNLLFSQNSLLNCCCYETFDFVQGDSRDEATLASLLKKAEVIIPLASLVGMPICSKDKIAAETTNQGAVELICKLASKDQKIVFPTTNSGYGIGEQGKFCTEETPLNPISLYGTSKVNVERAVLDRENSVTFRLATVFGMSPRMRVDLLVNNFVYRAVNDRAVVIFEGHFNRNFIHIRDVARVFLYAINNFEKMKGEAYNFGLEDATLSELERCKRIQKRVPSFVYLEAPIGEDPDKRDYIVSNQKILSIGFKNEWDLIEISRN